LRYPEVIALHGNPGRINNRKAFRTAILALCALAVLGAAGFGWLVSTVAYWEQREQSMGQRDNSDTIIVLGAQVKAWGEPSEALLRRMTLALSHYRAYPRMIVCCGGQGADEPMAEGDFMRDWMIEQGVPPESVISENTSRNTRENIAGAKKIMDEYGLSRALVVTSDYHLPRALAVCRSQGVDAIGDGSPSRPDLWWKNHLRESVSWIKFWLGL
jgi:uncharacterized SAM-binding protein YcdF (DUF218 family)